MFYAIELFSSLKLKLERVVIDSNLLLLFSFVLIDLRRMLKTFFFIVCETTKALDVPESCYSMLNVL